jgi:hypothetical protein
LYVHPGVPDEASGRLREELQVVHARVTSVLGLSAAPPPIYLYPSVEELRKHSCARAHADAYYDGAIHVAILGAGSDQTYRALTTRLTHEYVHHVLVSNGIGKPIWFQEGTAMLVADNAPSHYWQIWHDHPIAVNRMVSVFPTAQTAEDASTFYAQAYVMTEFLERLCLGRSGCGPAELVDALKSGRTSPENLFGWATLRRGADLFQTTPLPLGDAYTAEGDFGQRTKNALLDRALRPGATH